MQSKLNSYQVWEYDNSKWVIVNNNIFSENIVIMRLEDWPKNKDDTTNVPVDRQLFLSRAKFINEDVDNYIVFSDVNNTGKVIHYDGYEYVILKDTTAKYNSVYIMLLDNYIKDNNSAEPVSIISGRILEQQAYIVSEMSSYDMDRLEKNKKWFDKNNTNFEVEVVDINGNFVTYATSASSKTIDIIEFNYNFNPVDMIDDNSDDKRKHSHYYKDIRHLEYIDIYRFCDLFIENDPSGALHHAIKKLAACGRRGAGKDELKDLREAVDTINRKIEMLEEDKLKK